MKERKTFENALAELPGFVHGRNAQLVRLAHLGLRAGHAPEILCGEIIAAGGEPLLTVKEVKRAIETALRSHGEVSLRPRGRKGVPLPLRTPVRGPNAKEKDFVRFLIAAGAGAGSRDLMAVSPVSVTGPDAVGAFLRGLFRPGELVFVGTPYMPRTRQHLREVEELIRCLGKGGSLPTHFAPNPFTGEGAPNTAGKVSYCLDKTVAHRRHALVEFDALTLSDQAAFWMGAIKERLLPVRSLVYSGAKSIHGLLELEEDGHAETWNRQWATLERLLCSDPDAVYQADRACKNPSRLTRFPQALRPETGRHQRLLWLSGS